jgi:hypothetical protein
MLFINFYTIYDIFDGVLIPVGDLPESVIIVHEDDAEKIGTIKSHRVVLSSSWERGDTGLRSWIDSAVQPVLLAVKRVISRQLQVAPSLSKSPVYTRT